MYQQVFLENCRYFVVSMEFLNADAR